MISIFTPFHLKDPTFLKEAYESLKEQTFSDWEWIILLNGDILSIDISFLSEDKRVKIHHSSMAGNIGALKRQCCLLSIGEICLELDYDDLLTSNCLQEIFTAFEDKDVQMVYSNSCGFENETWKPAEVFSEYYGWKSRPFIYKDHPLVEMIAWKPSAQMMRRIEWAPNHVRAWRKSSYVEIGGHNASLINGDDHDLCCRYYIRYGQKGIKHIDKCLYIYRVHGTNTVKLQNAQIQHQTDQNYLKYSRDLALRWAKDNNLKCIDLGGRFDCPEGYKSVDLSDADIICDLNKKWKFMEDSVGVIRASHVLEHLENPIHVMNEAYRVLAGGGFFFIDVPSTDGRGAFQDPTHRNCFWNQNSFFYYTRNTHARYIKGKHMKPEYKGRFQMSRVVTWFPNDFMKENNIPVVQADLICLKPPYSERPCGEVLI